MVFDHPTALEVRELAAYLSQVSGIELDASKGYLLESRLAGIAEELNCRNLTCLLERVRRDVSGSLRDVLVDAVSTNETYFFREPQHFALLQHKLIPEHYETASSRRCRIWCAAVATGQELYSLGIVLREMFARVSEFGLSLLGTDISNKALAQASRGEYSQLEVSRGLTPERLQRHFVARNGKWTVCDDLRAMATFQRLNLLDTNSSLGTFDIVFCRNVAIYFSPANRSRLLSNLGAHVRRGGWLLVSATENLGNVPEPFLRQEHRGVVYYQRK